MDRFRILALSIVLVFLTTPCFGVVQVYDVPHECYVKPGDVLLGFVARIRTSREGECSSSVKPSRLSKTEGFIFAVNRINEREDLLPNITVGFVIIDSCLAMS